jgi:hypothetical protein
VSKHRGAIVSLYDLQQSFLNAVVNDVAELPGLTDKTAGNSAAALDIHRNNWRSNLSNALRASYPVVERLVGAEFFAYAANCYIDENPSRSSNLEEYGGDFAEFLSNFPAAQSLPYLADIATLEATIEKVLVAADDGYSAYSLYSQFPILRIWQVNQPGWSGDDSVDLAVGADYLLVRRSGDGVVIEPIGADQFSALQVNMLQLNT